jgi:hypothetical protein
MRFNLSQVIDPRIFKALGKALALVRLDNDI